MKKIRRKEFLFNSIFILFRNIDSKHFDIFITSKRLFYNFIGTLNFQLSNNCVRKAENVGWYYSFLRLDSMTLFEM